MLSDSAKKKTTFTDFSRNYSFSPLRFDEIGIFSAMLSRKLHFFRDYLMKIAFFPRSLYDIRTILLDPTTKFAFSFYNPSTKFASFLRCFHESCAFPGPFDEICICSMIFCRNSLFSASNWQSFHYFFRDRLMKIAMFLQVSCWHICDIILHKTDEIHDLFCTWLMKIAIIFLNIFAKFTIFFSVTD